jgi:hypothetical protein
MANKSAKRAEVDVEDEAATTSATTWAGSLAVGPADPESGAGHDSASDAEAESHYDEMDRQSQASVESARTTASRPNAHASARKKTKRAEKQRAFLESKGLQPYLPPEEHRIRRSIVDDQEGAVLPASSVTKEAQDVKIRGSVASTAGVANVFVREAAKKAKRGFSIERFFERPVMDNSGEDFEKLRREMEKVVLGEDGCLLCATKGASESHDSSMGHAEKIALQVHVSMLLGTPPSGWRPRYVGYTTKTGFLRREDLCDFWGSKWMLSQGGFVEAARKNIAAAGGVLLKFSQKKPARMVPPADIIVMKPAWISYKGMGKYSTNFNTLIYDHQVDGFATASDVQWWPVMTMQLADYIVKESLLLGPKTIPEDGPVTVPDEGPVTAAPPDDDGPDDNCLGDVIELTPEEYARFASYEVPCVNASCIYQLMDKRPTVWSVGIKAKDLVLKDARGGNRSEPSAGSSSGTAAPPPPEVHEC